MIVVDQAGLAVLEGQLAAARVLVGLQEDLEDRIAEQRALRRALDLLW